MHSKKRRYSIYISRKKKQRGKIPLCFFLYYEKIKNYRKKLYSKTKKSILFDFVAINNAQTHYWLILHYKCIIFFSDRY